MAYDFGTMQTEVFSRGFSELNDAGTGLARVKRWINDAAHDVDDMERWPYRMASSTGTSPISSITDLGEIESVRDSNNQVLLPSTRSDLIGTYGDLTTQGAASFYYLNGSSVTAYPVTSLTLTVNYWKVGPDMSGSTDVPLMPDRFRPAIVELAVAKAYRDIDNVEMMAVCQAEAERIIGRMREFYELQIGGQRVGVAFQSEDW